MYSNTDVCGCARCTRSASDDRAIKTVLKTRNKSSYNNNCGIETVSRACKIIFYHKLEGQG